MQEKSRDFYLKLMYGSWELTKNYQDTGGYFGFVSIARQEKLSPSDGSVDNEEEGGGSDGEANEEGQEVDGAFRGNMSPPASVFAQMQGGNEGIRPFTAVLTEADMKKFDTSVLGFLANTPASGNRPPGQSIDFDAFAESWNADV